ncbi:acyl-CoA dehydrogenase family protein [Novosphingobium sp. SG720]|uniref:acyl-CoA dehydrogenase family protein n=1 Tax=Novosphingobium sp. SG720 TaxID=2586998 RepID=UPI0018240E2E|nr:acyl-CoA dehydrogenase family protein [Novosphingobium sp. SG720]NKJ44790.1 3-hydroxy-9,10-secoandrosta-1,3,5(10)-triene-9,17-dione monooxygenase [Novosphingobium sp. SG720]
MVVLEARSKTFADVPEPGLSPQDMIARARAMIPTLRSRQAQAEAAGRLLEVTNQEFLDAGFYRIVQPRVFGGYEFELTTYVQVMMEIARGCPSSAWVLALVSGHPIMLADFDIRAQEEAYGDKGDYRCPSVGSPVLMQREGNGYRVSGSWDYASGCDVSTHAMVSGMARDETGAMSAMLLLIDRKDFTITDNWSMIGMQGTGSRKVVVKDLYIPAYRTAPMSMWQARGGTAVHPNPMYNGRKGSYFLIELGAVVVGTVKGALDLYEEICRTKSMRFPPKIPLFESHEFQQYFGDAQGKVDAAEALLLKVVERYVEACAADPVTGGDFSEETDRRLFVMAQEACRLAWDALEIIFTTAGTSIGAKDSMLARIYRDASVQKTHFVQQRSRTAVNAARLHFGLPALTPF